MQNTVKLTPSQRRAILRSADESQKNISIVVIPGIAIAPRTRGESWHYETRSGIRIYHPAAYSRRGWSSMVYHHSTRRVEVGEQWLAAAA